MQSSYALEDAMNIECLSDSFRSEEFQASKLYSSFKK
jgi:hypothetical protein